MHGGCKDGVPVEKQDNEVLMWDRDLWKSAKWWQLKDPNHKFITYDEIFIGHTSTDTKCFVAMCGTLTRMQAGESS